MDTLSSPPESTTKTSHRKPLRRWLGGAVAVLAVATLGWFLFAPSPVKVELATVTQGPLQVTVNNQGQVRAHDRYIIAAPVAAELERVELHDGDPVRRNQVIAILSPLPMDARQKQEALARLDAAKALAREAALRTQRAYTDLQFAANERARIERLIENGFVSPQAADKALTTEKTSRAEWNAAKSHEQAALADVRTAEAALLAVDMPAGSVRRQIQLASPVDGYILKVHEKSVRTVTAGTSIATVGDPTRYEVVVDVLSTDAVKIKPGAAMLLEGWGGGQTLRAKVRLVEPVAFTKVSALGVEEQRVNIIADPIDSLGALGDGYRVEARIVVWSMDNVMKVPASSLFRVGDAWHVFVVQSGRAREHAVTVGQRNQDEAQIISGLTRDMQVVRYPSNQLRDGVRVAAQGKNGE